MKKSKFISFLTACSLGITTLIGLVPAQAQNLETAAVEKGYSIEYNKDSSTATTRVIDVYMVGLDSFFTSEMAFDVPEAVTDAKFSFDITTDVDGSNLTNGGSLVDGVVRYKMVANEYVQLNTDSATKVGTITLTVNEGTADFDVVLSNEEIHDKDDVNVTTDVDVAATKITVSDPAATEPPVVTDAPLSVEKGYELVYNKKASTSTTRVIDVYIKNLDSFFTSEMAFAVPEGVTDAKFAFDITTDVDGSNLTNGGSLVDGVVRYKMVANEYVQLNANASTKVGTITLTVNEDIADFDVVLSNEEIHDKDDVNVTTDVDPANTKISITDPNAAEPTATTEATAEPTATTEATAEPTATPNVTTRPTAIPVVTDAPVVTYAPTNPPVEVDKGYMLVYNKKASTSTTRVIDVYIKNLDSFFTSEMAFAVPEGVTDAKFAFDITTDVESSNLTNGGSLVDGVVRYKMVANEYVQLNANASTKVGTITLTVNEDIADFDVVLSNEEIHDKDDVNVTTNVNLANTKISITDPNAAEPTTDPTAAPTAAPTAFPADTSIAMKDTIADSYDKQSDYGTLVGVQVTAKKNGAEAAYGTDFVAEYPEGTVLTEDEYNNLINGYTESDITKVVDGIIFKTKYDVEFTTAPMYQTAEDKAKSEAGEVAEATVLPAYGKTVKATAATPTPTPTATPTATPTVRPSTGGGGSSSSSHSGTTIAAGSGTSTSGSGVVATTSFTDLDSVPWAQTAINVLAGNGIVNGVSANTFEPLSPVTRAQFAKMVCAAFGVAEQKPATATFTDVSPSDWFYGYVEAAAANGIVLGVSDTEFDPNALVTREQMAAMMYRAITANNVQLKTGAAKSFTDAASISAYAVAPVNALSSAGVINGKDDGSFAPQANATRAEAACIIYQYFLSLAQQ